MFLADVHRRWRSSGSSLCPEWELAWLCEPPSPNRHFLRTKESKRSSRNRCHWGQGWHSSVSFFLKCSSLYPLPLPCRAPHEWARPRSLATAPKEGPSHNAPLHSDLRRILCLWSIHGTYCVSQTLESFASNLERPGAPRPGASSFLLSELSREPGPGQRWPALGTNSNPNRDSAHQPCSASGSRFSVVWVPGGCCLPEVPAPWPGRGEVPAGPGRVSEEGG